MWEDITKILEVADKGLSGDSITEERTKQFLIEPILKTLGWNLAAPSEVQREYKQVVDYALFGRRLTLFLEAKRLGIALDSAMQQVLNYAIQKDVRPDFVVTTDGVQWNCVSMRYQSVVFALNLRQASEDQRRQFELLRKEAVDAGALTNYANQIRTEQEVLDYLKRHAERIADEIREADKSFDRQDIITYLQALASRSLIRIQVGEPAGASLSALATSTLTPRPSYQRSSATPKPVSTSGGGNNPASLDKGYLSRVAQRMAEIEQDTGAKVYVRFGIKGAWLNPNYQVETANGSQVWTFHGPGQQKPHHFPRFDKSNLTHNRYSRDDIAKLLT